MRVAFNIVFASNYTDVRSDDEDNAEEAEGEGSEERGKEKEKAKKRGKGKKGVDGGPAYAQVNGLNLTIEEKSFAEVVQQGEEKKKDL